MPLPEWENYDSDTPWPVLGSIDLCGQPVEIRHLVQAFQEISGRLESKELYWRMHGERFADIGRRLGKQLKMNVPIKDAPRCPKCKQFIGEYIPPDPLMIMEVRVRLMPEVGRDEIIIGTDEKCVKIRGIG